MKLEGTEFQIKVWKEISKIPYGETRTYKELALAIGRPNSSRAVANACGKNPYPPTTVSYTHLTLPTICSV